MKRQLTRLIFPTLFLSMFVLIFEPAPVKSANLNVALSIPMKHYRVKDWYKPYADKIAKLTNGKVKLVIFASNSLVKDEQMYDKITIIFSSVIGIIVGIGSILQSLILMILLYGISQSSLLNLIEDKDEDVNNGDLVDNLEEFVEEN